MKWNRDDYYPDYEFGCYERREYSYPSTNNMDAILEDCPHYSDNRFKNDQTIFGKEEKGLGYDYSDRICQWNYAKAEAASKKATEDGFTRRTARWYQAYLSNFFDRKIVLKHIIAGVNRSNGYPYLIFGYK
jgi:hypothetical protein